MALRDRFTALAVRPHMPRRTVRLRLTVLYGALFLVSGAALLAVTYVLVSHSTSIPVVISGKNGASGTAVGVSGPDRVGQSHRLVGGGGEVTRATGPLSGAAGPVLQLPRGLTRKQMLAQARQLQAVAADQRTTELHQLLIKSGVALAIMAMLSIALGWLVAGRVLRPLRTITAAAKDISATNLHERLALDGPDDELKELGDTFDGLLARLERSFQSQRQFVANASHELRTPLAPAAHRRAGGPGRP